MKNILLDTNIVIYLFHGDRTVIAKAKELQHNGYAFHISIITWIEILAGSRYHGGSRPYLEDELNAFIHIPLDEAIGRKAAYLFEHVYKKAERVRYFQDGLIAATAMQRDMQLLTRNIKDFQRFRGLHIMKV